MALLIAGGAFYIVGGIVAGMIVGGLMVFSGALSGQSMTAQASGVLATSIGFGLLTGVLIIIGGVMVNSGSRKVRIIGGVLAITMSVIGLVNTAAGLVIGFVLTLVGAIVGITHKEPEGAPQAARQVTVERVKVRCTSCGHLNEDESTFCRACGAKLK